MTFDTPSHDDPMPADDLSALSWVHDEVRRTLEAAHKSLRRHLRESDSILGSDVDAVDPAVLRQARAQVHQAAAVLDMIGMPPASALLRASEAAIQKLIAKPSRADLTAIETIERASFALLDFVARRLAGKAVSPMALFPQYRAVQELAGADRMHPSDLWHDELPDIELPGDAQAGLRTPGEDFRNELEIQMLALLRQPRGTAAAQMSRMFAALANGAEQSSLATLWRLAAAVFEGQAHGLLPVNLYGKRLAPRLLAQLRLCETDPDASGSGAATGRLRRDLLFFCLQAGPAADGESTPRLAAARRAFGLSGRAGADYEAPQLGRFDPALVTQARKRVVAAKDAWSAVAAGELMRLGSLGEQFALVGDSLRRLYPGGEALADALAGAAGDTAGRGEPPSPELAMEVATGVLYVEASLEDADFDHPALRERVGRLAQRIATVRSGLPAPPLEGWIEDLYRRVSDRQTMGSVVHELRASIGEAEKQIDQYFRDPARRDALLPAVGQLLTMRGVLSVLGLDDAARAVQRMRDDVEALVDGDEGADTGDTVERLTTNLGRLGFLVDMLGAQPALAKTLFAFDARSGTLGARGGASSAPAGGSLAAPLPPPPTDLFGQAQSLAVAALQPEVTDTQVSLSLDRLSHEALVADQPRLAEAASRAHAALDRAGDDATRQNIREDLALKLSELVESNTPLAVELPPPSPVPPPSPPAAPGQTGLEDDAEMREIFLEEAREVVSTARSALAALAQAPDEIAELTAVRRAFHTLKGSSRMVGLAEFGEAAWACEQLYNARLAEAPRADDDLRGFTGEALDYLGGWIEAIAEGRDAGHAAVPVQQAADALRVDGRREPLTAPGRMPAASVPVPDGSSSPAEAAAETTEVAQPVCEQADAVSDADPPAAVDEPAAAAEEAEPYKVVGPLRIGIPLFNIYLGEADELSRRLATELAEWTHEVDRPVGESAIALAHSLAGSSATVGYQDLSQLARALEHALARSHAVGHGNADEAALFELAADTIRRMLHQFAAGFLPPAPEHLLERFAAHEREAVQQVAPEAAAAPAEGPMADAEASPGTAAWASAAEEPPAETSPAPDVDVWPDAPGEPAVASSEATFAPDDDVAGPVVESFALDVIAPVALLEPVEPPAFEESDDIDVEDMVDAELYPIFEEEAQDLLPQLAARMRDWASRPGDASGAAACMRTLHTLKGGARLAGAMRLGEMAHRLETAVEHLLARGGVETIDVERLQGRVDQLGTAFEALRGGDALPAPSAPQAVVAVAGPQAPEEAASEAAQASAVDAPREVDASSGPVLPIDWSRFGHRTVAAAAVESHAAAGSAGAVRIRVPLLDRLVNHAGEVSITRARIEADVDQLKSSLSDLTENLDRLRSQLRDLELQAETQITSRLEQAKAAAEAFDPLELDRFTRFQELTRMMAESVNDVATVQRSLQRALQSAEDELAAQARLTRDLQADLLRTRMVEFDGLSERLYRVVRQAAKETGKQVRLDVVGGSIEVDRGVLDRMTPAFEHLLRNCVTHGIERPDTRVAAGKEASGQITVTLTHEGNEVGIEFRDDGAGLNLARIRDRGLAMGLLAPDAQPGDDELSQLIFAPGFSTAEQVTELAGRGIGMDVVRSEVLAMGGRIETASTPGHGTAFRLVLPLTTAVTQVVMLRCGEVTVAVPSTLIEAVRRVPTAEVEAAHRCGSITVGSDVLPLFWLGALLELSAGSAEPGRNASVVTVRSARQRVAIQVDEVIGKQEVVVKNLGPQLSRLPGLAGMTLLPSGQPALIYNPVALAALYGQRAREMVSVATPVAAGGSPAPANLPPLVLVVDDSLTVRRVTQRLLAREGYRVALAKDGLEALERLAEEKPAIVLSDIEMPRMDGFDLVRNLRGDARWRALPVIMITSRIAQKHREVAAQLGVDHYLGKPYSEEDLLALVARHASAPAAA